MANKMVVWFVRTFDPQPRLLTFLTTWEVWNDKNSWVFYNRQAPPMVIFERIKKETKLWITADAKILNVIMPALVRLYLPL
jgi:hypothetical protein